MSFSGFDHLPQQPACFWTCSLKGERSDDSICERVAVAGCLQVQVLSESHFAPDADLRSFEQDYTPLNRDWGIGCHELSRRIQHSDAMPAVGL